MIICLMSALILAGIYFKIVRTFAELPSKSFTIRVEQESMTFQTNESVTTVKWSGIKRIWKFPDFWFIFRNTTGLVCSALPVAPLGTEVSKTIEAKVRQHGGLIC
jgi:hypothetical protein